MKFLIALVILTIFIGLYTLAYLVNKRVNKPEGCKDLECNKCKLNCNRRGEYNG